MSLMRLLSSGRSWVGQKESTRYRMTDPRAMPKFGSGKNYFRAKLAKAAPATSSQPTPIQMNEKAADDVVCATAGAERPALPVVSRGDRAGANHLARAEENGVPGQMDARGQVEKI